VSLPRDLVDFIMRIFPVNTQLNSSLMSHCFSAGISGYELIKSAELSIAVPDAGAPPYETLVTSLSCPGTKKVISGGVDLNDADTGGMNELCFIEQSYPETETQWTTRILCGKTGTAYNVRYRTHIICADVLI